MMLDYVLWIMAGFLLAISFFYRFGAIASMAVCASLLFDRLMFSPVMTYDQLLLWAILLSTKDYAFILLFGIRRQTKELPLLVSFSVSCLLHQAIVLEVYNRDLTLFYLRPDIMSVLVSAMLASVIYIQITGGGSNGGKRSVNRRISNDYRFHNLLYLPAFKVTK